MIDKGFGVVIAGFVIGMITFFIFLIGLSFFPVENSGHDYITIDGIVCLKIDDDFVSCNWDEWEGGAE